MPTCYCQYCGQSAANVSQLTAAACMRHPEGPFKGRHRLYEGTAATPATCRYCGHRATDIRQLIAAQCMRHPDGPFKGRHAPALHG